MPFTFTTTDEGMTDLGTSGGIYIYSEATDINDSGQVVGNSFVDFYADSRAFITGPNGQGMTDLGTLGGTESEAYGINDLGQVVGRSTITDGSWYAFMTGPRRQGDDRSQFDCGSSR